MPGVRPSTGSWGIFACLVTILVCTRTQAGEAQAERDIPETELQAAPVPLSAPPESAPQARDGVFSRLIDEEDHHIDFSNFLAGGGFIPVPVIITEPAVDGGGGLAAAFFKADPDHPRRVTRHVVGAVNILVIWGDDIGLWNVG